MKNFIQTVTEHLELLAKKSQVANRILYWITRPYRSKQSAKMASNTFGGLTCNNLFIVNAAVSGFAAVKFKTKTDYAFVIEVDWSDERIRFIKRTFSDFLSLNYKLLQHFSQEIKALPSDPGLRLPGRTLFRRNSSELAESREAQLHQYVTNLLKLPEKISQSAVVLSFFESRHGDPKPYKQSSPSEKSDSGIDLTSEYDGDDERVVDNDDEYFMDFGPAELLLSDDMDMGLPLSPSAMWCSNLEKLPKILMSSMNNMALESDLYSPQDYQPMYVTDEDYFSEGDEQEDDEGDEAKVMKDMVGKNTEETAIEQGLEC